VAHTLQSAQDLPTGLLIGGSWLHETSAGVLPHVNPATGQLQANFPVAGPDEVDRAVRSAHAALSGWRTWAPAEREAILRRLAAILREQAADFGFLGAKESGIPLSVSNYLSPASAQWIEYYAGWIDEHTGETVPADGALDYTRPEPIGVVAVILTWNSSAAAFGASVGAALAAGCCVVVKPAEPASFFGYQVRPGLPGGRVATGRRQRGARRSGGWRRLGPSPGNQQDQLHRQRRDGQGHPSRGRRVVDAAAPRAGRQVRQGRLRRRRPRGGCVRGGLRSGRAQRADLHSSDPAARRASAVTRTSWTPFGPKWPS
jgi:hypothetical protein